MANTKGKNRENYIKLSQHIENEIRNNRVERIRLTPQQEFYIISDVSQKYVGIDIDTGELYRIKIDSEGTGRLVKSDGGSDKANARQYIRFSIEGNDGFMLANYVLQMALGRLSDNFDDTLKSMEWYDGIQCGTKLPVINHIDGNTENNSLDNLEVTTNGMNNAHGRLMSELHHTFPGEYVEEYGKTDSKGNRPLRFINGNRVTSEDIEKFNKTHNSKLKIKGRLNKGGEFRPYYSSRELEVIIKDIGLKGVSQ